MNENNRLIKQKIMLENTIAEVVKKLDAIQRENDIIRGKPDENIFKTIIHINAFYYSVFPVALVQMDDLQNNHRYSADHIQQK
jgi:hypothetical protein